MFDFFGGGAEFKAADRLSLRRVERKLDLILAHLGIENSESEGDLPADVKAYADAGEKIAAIKAYRDATGAGLAEAKEAVERYLGQR